MDWRLVRACELWLHSFDRKWAKLRTDEAELAEQRAHQPCCGPVSVVIPVWNTRPEWLRALGDCLRAQTLAQWEAVLYDGCSDVPETLEALRELAASDPRIRVVTGTENLGISGNTNCAFRESRGDYVAFCDHDDLVEPDALWRLAAALTEQGADVAYSDEDRITEDGRTHYAPHFKPDICPENLLACNYICHMTMVRRSLLEQVGGLRPVTDGSQDHDLMLRLVKAGARFVHVPHILYHWRNNGGSMSHARRDKCLQAAQQALRDHLSDANAKVEIVANQTVVVWKPPEGSRVLVLLSGDEDSARACEGLFLQGSKLKVQVIRADRKEFPRLLRENDHDLILLWDADVVPDVYTLPMLASLACREDVGAVYPVLRSVSGKIASAGLGIRADGSLFHRSRGANIRRVDPLRLESYVHQVACGSDLCVMLKRSLLPEDGLPDAAFATGLQARGLRNLVIPFATALCRKAIPLPPPLPAGTPDGTLTSGLIAQRHRR